MTIFFGIFIISIRSSLAKNHSSERNKGITAFMDRGIAINVKTNKYWERLQTIIKYEANREKRKRLDNTSE
ncbi:MAG: hypothetical protein QW775_06905 [Ignisphaera sp.]